MLAAMIALAPLPGAPLYDGNESAIVNRALDDLERYMAAGVDAVFIENSLDLPYVKPPLPRTALNVVLRVAREIRGRFEGPIGIQLLEAANEAALNLAAVARLDYVRVEGYVFGHIGGAGFIEGCAGQLHRMRKDLQVPNIKLLADIKKKHCSHALTGDLSIADVAKQAAFFLADGLIVTGGMTGEAPLETDLKAVREVTSLPVWVGSGMTPENLDRLRPLADGCIVGSTFREQGQFTKPLDPERLARFMDAWRRIDRDASAARRARGLVCRVWDR